MQSTATRSAVGLLPLATSSGSTTARLAQGVRSHNVGCLDSLPSGSRTLVSTSRPRPTLPRCQSCAPVSCASFARTFSTSRPSFAAPKDPYGVLGVKKESNAKDIKRAYYELAKKYHPDTNKDKGAKERFVEIQNAYDVLSDDKKRSAYDNYGTTDGQPGFDPFGGGGSSPFGAGGFGGFQDFGGFANAGNAGSIFESMFGAFGGGRQGQRASGFGNAGFAGEQRGEDLETTINLTFEEACKGTKRKVVINPIDRCGTCSGSGLKTGAKKSTCATCNGTGTRTFVIQSGFQMATTCPSCGGAGSTVAQEDNCKSCDGLGRVRGRREVEIDLPAGVDDGFRIRKDGFGDVPLSGAGTPGSLYVRINVAPSKTWRRQGSTLFYPAIIPFHTAILGGKVRVQTLDGPVEVRVPPGTQIGEEMLLQGRGVPSPTRRGQKGDLLVQFEVAMPRSLTKKQRELLQMYADEVEGRAAKSGATPTPTPAPAPASTESGGPQSTKATDEGASQPDANEQTKTNSQAKPKTQPNATSPSKGRFTIHASSRSDENGSSSNKAQTQTKAAASEVKKDSKPEKSALGKAWDWLTGSSQ